MRPRDRLLRRGIPKEAIRKELERWSDGLWRWNQAFSALVVGGLAIEFVPDAASFLGMFSHDVFIALHGHSDHLHEFGGFVVVVGIVAEFLVAMLDRQVETDLRDESNTEIERLREANDEMERMHTWRQLPDVEAFTDAMRSFGNVTYLLRFAAEETEPSFLAFQLHTALRNAGWIPIGDAFRRDWKLDPGVSIRRVVRSHETLIWFPAQYGIADWLDSKRIAVSVSMDSGQEKLDPDTLLIDVGLRPKNVEEYRDIRALFARNRPVTPPPT
jgi:hypothetical protein